MSETEYVKGKIKQVRPICNQSLEDLCKQELEKNKIPKEEYYDTYQEALEDELSEKYLIVGGSLYEFIECVSVDINSADIRNIDLNMSGELDFEVLFYNGGCSLSEAIESAMRKNLES